MHSIIRKIYRKAEKVEHVWGSEIEQHTTHLGGENRINQCGPGMVT